MSEKNAKYTFNHSHHILPIATLLLLLFTIMVTVTTALHTQTIKSKANGIDPTTHGTPTYLIGQNSNASIQTIHATTETLITPTIYCLGGIPCTSPNPTEMMLTTSPITTSQEVIPTTQVTEQMPSNSSTINPCETAQSSIQTYGWKKGHGRGHHNGFIKHFFEFLIRFVMELLKQLGLQNPQRNPQEQPATTPSQPTSLPTRDPCVSVQPTKVITPEPTISAGNEQNPTPTIFGTTIVPPQQQTPGKQTTQGFLRTSGKNLMLNGQVLKYVGVNAFQIAGTQEYGASYSKAELDALFAALPPHSLTRAWLWNNSNLEQAKLAIQSAEEHNQFLILTLSEGAGWDKVGQKNNDWYLNGYKTYLLPWIDTVVSQFKDSKAIGMWEIMNEPAGDQQNPSYEAVKGFMATVAARIKQNDPNHLVGTGAIRCSVPGFATNCADINNDPNIDVMSSHDYSGDATITNTFLEDKQQLDSINKPWIIGEAGILGGDYGGGSNCPRSGAERANMIKQKIDAYFKDGRIAGINLWIYTKNASCGSDGYDFNLTDPIIPLLKSYVIQ